MKIPVHIAKKLLLLVQGGTVPSGSARHPFIEELVSEGIIERNGRIKKILRVRDADALNNYLKNKCSIISLAAYIELSIKESVLRNELILVSSDSKLRKVRTFKGFLVNCFNPVKATLNSKTAIIHPVEGTFQFIYDFENFTPSPDTTIVGVENPENFRHIEAQKYLFKNINPLFVSRYPQNQSKDLIKWLQAIPNNYLHFGDFDFAGIGIYINEFKKHLFDKSSMFIPGNIDGLIKHYGNKERYDNQKINFDINMTGEPELNKLIDIIHKYRKGLDQEIFINELTPANYSSASDTY